MNKQRYQRGGDIYAKLESQYGTAGADLVATAAMSSDPYAINDALTKLKYGNEDLETNVWSILGGQLTTDPLAAPLESANNQIGNAVLGIFKNPWVLFALVAVVFYMVGGFDYVKRQISKA